MEPQIQYVRSGDGTNIAYTVMGEGVPMIFSPNIWCHLSIQLSGEFREAWEQIARDGILLVPYDMRGMGMSDRAVEDFSLDAQMADIDALAGQVGFDRFALYGNVFGSLASIAYAAHHPERVSHPDPEHSVHQRRGVLSIGPDATGTGDVSGDGQRALGTLHSHTRHHAHRNVAWRGRQAAGGLDAAVYYTRYASSLFQGSTE